MSLRRDELDVQPPLRHELLDCGAHLRRHLLAVREQLVEARLAGDVAEHHARAVPHGGLEVLDVEDRLLDVDDLVVDDRVDRAP